MQIPNLQINCIKSRCLEKIWKYSLFWHRNGLYSHLWDRLESWPEYP